MGPPGQGPGKVVKIWDGHNTQYDRALPVRCKGSGA